MPAQIDRESKESSKANAAWLVYRDMDPHERSISACARKCGKHVNLIRRWAKVWQWADRLAKWDADAAKREQMAIEEASRAKAHEWAARQQELRDRQYALSQKLISKAEAMLEFPLAKKVVKDDGTTHIHPARWDMASAARMADVGVELARLATGLPTEKTEISGPDGAPVVASVGSVVIELPDNGRTAGK